MTTTNYTKITFPIYVEIKLFKTFKWKHILKFKSKALF